MSRVGRIVAGALGLGALLAGAPGAAAEPGYRLTLPASVEVPAGEPGAASLTLTPAPDHSISRDGPLVIELAVAPAQGLRLPRARYERADAADAHAEAPRFDLRFRAEAAGDYRLRVRARFWVCRTRTCWPAREEREVAVTVRAPAPPDADAGGAETAPTSTR